MKKYNLALFVVTVISCLLLRFLFQFDLTKLVYHLVVVTLIYSLFHIGIRLLMALPLQHKTKIFLFYAATFIFFLTVLNFYVLILGSNFFWSKTITFSIFSNYLNSLEDTIAIIPLKKNIVLLIFAFYILLQIFLYILIKPSFNKKKDSTAVLNTIKFNKATLITSAIVLLLIVLFNKQLIQIKQTIHFAGEPVLQFSLGEMWGNNNEIAFDNKRYINGLNDQECINAIKKTTSDRTIMIILIDALRMDHLSPYGYSRETTPFLDSLYKNSKLKLVENAFSTSTNTIGGIAGLFFSKDWEEFGFNGLSLMKFLKKSGYSTYAFLTGFHRDWYGLSSLYSNSCDYYYESSINPKIKNDDDLVTLEEFNKVKLNPKSFVYIHLLSVHALGKRNDEFKRFMPDKIDFNTSKKTALINNYDNGIYQSDYVIKEIFNKLKDEDKLNNTTIFILSDHGEMFGEEGRWGHGGEIHENLLSIPILIYDDSLNWYKNLKTATLKDIAPTIADRINSKIPDCWEGNSLQKPSYSSTIEINSVDGGMHPFGNLDFKNDTIKLKIFDANKNLRKTKIYQKGTWKEN